MIKDWWDRVRRRAEQSGPLHSHVEEIPLDAILKSGFQPRSRFPRADLQELAKSIAEVGVIEPIIVRPAEQKDTYELVVGERRWRACRLAGLQTVPAVVRELDDCEVAIFAMTENLQREDLHFLDEAEGYRRILDEFDMTQSELARDLGISQPAISNKVRLLSLEEEILKVIRSSELSERHARALLQLPDAASQQEVLQAVMEQDMTVKQMQDLVDNTLDKEMGEQAEEPSQKVQGVIRDMRIFLNGLRQTVQTMRDSGLQAQMTTSEEDDRYRIVIEIEKSAERNKERAGGESVQ